MEWKGLTNGKLIELCKENKYLLVRFIDNQLIGINCKMALISAKQKNPDLQKTSNIMEYRQCDLMEYLTYKISLCGENGTRSTPEK